MHGRYWVNVERCTFLDVSIPRICCSLFASPVYLANVAVPQTIKLPFMYFRGRFVSAGNMETPLFLSSILHMGAGAVYLVLS